MQKNAGFGIIKSIKLPHLSAFIFRFRVLNISLFSLPFLL